MTWTIRKSYSFTDYLLEGSPFFVSHPNFTAHARSIGLPQGYRYAIYQRGGDPSGCAGWRGMTKTLKAAKDLAGKLAEL